MNNRPQKRGRGDLICITIWKTLLSKHIGNIRVQLSSSHNSCLLSFRSIVVMQPVWVNSSPRGHLKILGDRFITFSFCFQRWKYQFLVNRQGLLMVLSLQWNVFLQWCKESVVILLILQSITMFPLLLPTQANPPGLQISTDGVQLNWLWMSPWGLMANLWTPLAEDWLVGMGLHI